MTTRDPERPEAERGFVPALLALLAVAVAVRWGRMPVAWDYWAVDYVSYPYPFRLDLGDGSLPWTRLSGLHPGQHSLITAGILAAGGTLRELFVLAVGLSVASIALGALWLRSRAGALAGLSFAALAALSPYQAHYGMELNNYPLLLAGAAATTVAFGAAWPRPDRSRWLAVALLLSATVALHAHLGAVPLIALLGVVALAGRRWSLAGALAAATALAGPVLVAAWRMREVGTTFHNEPVPLELLPQRLFEVWSLRFGGPVALTCIGAATALALVLALSDRRSRGPALLLTGVALAGSAGTVAGMVRGAAFVGQTPYWVHVSWCSLAVLALGIGAAGRWPRLMLCVLLLPWLLGAGWRALLPGAAAPAPSDLGEPQELATWIDGSFAAGDVLVYLWDVRYLNDEPTGRDPLFAAVRPGELGDWLPRDRPFPGYCHEYRGGDACFVNSTCTRGDEQEAALRSALRLWLGEGRRVHLVVAWSDPARGTFEPAALRGAVEADGARWRDGWAHRTRVVRIEPP